MCTEHTLIGEFIDQYNIEDMLEEVPPDQRDKLEIGCDTWSIQGVTVTLWPREHRAAVCWGGDSVWGDWDEDRQLIYLDDGITVNIDGQEIPEPGEDPVY